MNSLIKFLIIFLLVSRSVTAQEETLLGTGEISNGGFGGPVIKYTQINGESGLLVGGRGGWIINHTFVLGGGGYGLVTDLKTASPPSTLILPLYYTDIYINFGYGGIELEYIIQSDQLLHFSVYTLIGAGSVSFKAEETYDLYQVDLREYDYPTNTFFVFEPAVNAELNIVSFMRLCAGFSYRFISGVDLVDLERQCS